MLTTRVGPDRTGRTPTWFRRHPVKAGLAVGSLWLIVTGYLLVTAGTQARAGQQAAEGVRAQVSAGDLTGSDLAMGRARDHFAAASRRVGTPLVWPMRVLPFVGRQIRAFGSLTGAATQVSAASADTLRTAQAEIRIGRGPDDNIGDRLRRLADLAASTEARLGKVRLRPEPALIGPLARAQDRLGSGLADLRAGLRRGQAGARAAADLLGGPRTYLVLAANNAEMRSGSGMFLSAGVLKTAGGKLSMSGFRSTEGLLLPPGAVSLEGDLADRWGWLKPNEEWRNLGVSPRFDVTAPLAADMWQAAVGERVDGVLAVDPVALEFILLAVGPVEVDGQRLGSENVVERILHGQYVDHAGDTDQGARREELGRISGTVLAAIEDRDWGADALGRALARAGRGRHLLAWAARPQEQDGWVAAGIDGSLHEDSVMVAVLNRGANKLDRFLEVQGDLQLRPGRQSTEGELRLRVRNDVPAGEPMYVAGPDPASGVGEGVYVGIVAVNLPATARNAKVDGDDRLAVAGADGPTRIVGSVLQLARGEERTVVLRFQLPPGHGELRLEASARVPPIQWSAPGGRWTDGASRSIRW